MPFWPCQYTGGVPASGAIFSPWGETNQMGPIFSVTNMRPSGRKAIRQGSSNVDVVVMLKGSAASGFCSPTLTWVQAVAVRVRSNAALVDFIMLLLVYLSQKAARYSRAMVIRVLRFRTQP